MQRANGPPQGLPEPLVQLRGRNCSLDGPPLITGGTRHLFLLAIMHFNETYLQEQTHSRRLYSFTHHLGGCRCEAFTVAARSTSLHANIIVDLNGKCRYMRLEPIVHASVCDCNSTRIAELATARFDSDKYSGVKTQVLQGMVVKGHDRLS